jgi:hypothetical protein
VGDFDRRKPRWENKVPRLNKLIKVAGGTVTRGCGSVAQGHQVHWVFLFAWVGWQLGVQVALQVDISE